MGQGDQGVEIHSKGGQGQGNPKNIRLAGQTYLWVPSFQWIQGFSVVHVSKVIMPWLGNWVQVHLCHLQGSSLYNQQECGGPHINWGGWQIVWKKPSQHIILRWGPVTWPDRCMEETVSIRDPLKGHILRTGCVASTMILGLKTMKVCETLLEWGKGTRESLDPPSAPPPAFFKKFTFWPIKAVFSPTPLSNARAQGLKEAVILASLESRAESFWESSNRADVCWICVARWIKLHTVFPYSSITNVSTVGWKPQHRDNEITKPILPNISNPGQPIGLNYPWKTVRTENNEPS